jgi:hypothetical protein
MVIAQREAPSPRVRSEDPRIALAIAQGTERSATFRRLLRTIDATDGVVYVQPGECRRSVRACLHLWVGAAARYRFLRILVSARRAPGCELVTSIAHELQHAIEVLSEPRVRSAEDMYVFFDRKGAPGWRDTFETDEALEAGMQVEKEVCRGRGWQ